MGGKIENREVALLVCKGNTDALAFLEAVTEIAHVWDDLIDRDVQPADEEINNMMWLALVVLPRNAFYNANFAVLNPVLINAILNWQTATQLERDRAAPTDLPAAFILRSSYVDLIVMTAMLVGGKEHARQMAIHAHRLWHNEGFEEYLKELEREAKTRGE